MDSHPTLIRLPWKRSPALLSADPDFPPEKMIKLDPEETILERQDEQSTTATSMPQINQLLLAHHHLEDTKPTQPPPLDTMISTVASPPLDSVLVSSPAIQDDNDEEDDDGARDDDDDDLDDEQVYTRPAVTTAAEYAEPKTRPQPTSITHKRLIVEWLELPGSMARLEEKGVDRDVTLWRPMADYCGGDWNEHSMSIRFSKIIISYNKAKSVYLLQLL